MLCATVMSAQSPVTGAKLGILTHVKQYSVQCRVEILQCTLYKVSGRVKNVQCTAVAT